VAIDGATAASATETYAWSALGAIAELGYPTGLATSEPARSVSHVYDRGFLTSIPGYAASFTYHDNLALASVAHSNGVIDWIGRDPHRMGRPAALWTSGVAGGRELEFGRLRLRRRGQHQVARRQPLPLRRGVATAGSERLDPAGGGPGGGRGAGRGELRLRRLRQPDEPDDGDQRRRLLARHPRGPGSTNRLTGAVTYDAEGNVRTWNAAQYDFDALGRMTRMRSGSQDWLFAFTAGGERIVQIGGGGLGEKRWTWRDLAGRVLREWREPASRRPGVDPRLGLPRRGS
jgi:hypothetical protein